MSVYILKDDTEEGLEKKIKDIAEQNHGAINNIQFQAVAVPQIQNKEIVAVKVQYTAMVWAWG